MTNDSALSSPAEYDVVVLGAGPAGSVAALLLARAGARTLLVDNFATSEYKVGESLPGIARPLLTSLQIENLYKTVASLPCSGYRSAWGTEALQDRSAMCDPYGPGVHIDRVAFDEAILTAAKNAGAQVFCGRYVSSRRDEKRWMIVAKDRNALHEIRSRWVVDCTGRTSRFASSVGMKRLPFDNQIAVVGWFAQAPDDKDRSITLETSSNGWWYSAPLPHSKRVVVYFTDGDLLSSSGARSSNGFQILAEQTNHIRSYFVSGSMFNKLPLIALASTSRLEEPFGNSWLAAGDAAAAFDPIASMGIIDSMKGAREAVKAILDEGRSLDSYRQFVVTPHEKNIETRRAYYRMERRWRQSPFWSRRRE